jgi:hypothetical protein
MTAAESPAMPRRFLPRGDTLSRPPSCLASTTCSTVTGLQAGIPSSGATCADGRRRAFAAHVGTLVHVKGRSPGPMQVRALIVDNDWPAVREKQRLSPGLKVLSAFHLRAGTFAAWG